MLKKTCVGCKGLSFCFGNLTGILKAATASRAESHLVRHIRYGHTPLQTFLKLATVDVFADTYNHALKYK